MKKTINGREYDITPFADLRGANLRDADLRGADLRDADLRGADLTGADLGSANLRGADLGSADLRGADLTGADLGSADLRGAYLTGAYLGSADLRGADLGGADLRSANLTGAYLAGTKDEPKKVISTVAGRAHRSDGYEFIAFRTDDEGLVIRAGCRTFTTDEFRAHVAAQYPGSPKAEETLRIIDFLVAQAAQKPSLQQLCQSARAKGYFVEVHRTVRRRGWPTPSAKPYVLYAGSGKYVAAYASLDGLAVGLSNR